MARTGISSAEARRRVRIAQFAGLGVGVMAVALWAMDLPGLSSALPQKPALTQGGESAVAPSTAEVAKIDSEAPKGIAERLDVAANRPAVPVTETKDPKPEVTAGAPGVPWEYLGAIQEPDRLLALVSIKGRQKIVSEGTELKITTPAAEGRQESVDYAAKVTEIKREHVMIEEEGGATRKITLKEKTSSVAWVKNMPKTVPGAAGTALASTMTPEARQRLIAQGIDPGQAERARQAALLAATRGRTSEAQLAAMNAANQKMAQEGAEDADAVAAPKKVNGARSRAVPAGDAETADGAAPPRPNPRPVD